MESWTNKIGFPAVITVVCVTPTTQRHNWSNEQKLPISPRLLYQEIYSKSLFHNMIVEKCMSLFVWLGLHIRYLTILCPSPKPV